MARVNNLSNFLTDVASAIKTKKGSETNIPAANFDTEILALPSQGVYEQRVLNISANGSQTITPGAGFDAIDELALTVAVPEKQLQSKTYNFTQNTNIELLPDTGYDGFDSVTLNINVPGSTINNQDKTITPTTSQQVISADQGYTGLGNVTVNAVTSSIDQNIIASNIKDGVTILGVTGSNAYNSYEVVDYYDTNSIVNPQTNDICVVNNSWYNATYISNIRTLLNAQYELDYGEGSHQNNNVILYDLTTKKYYAIYKYNNHSEIFDWDSNGWDFAKYSEDPLNTPRWRDPAHAFNDQRLYMYIPDNNSLQIVRNEWSITFPLYTYNNIRYNFLIAYADKPVITTVPLTYKGLTYNTSDIVYTEPNASSACEVYQYNGTNWINIATGLVNTNSYNSMTKDVNNIIYGRS